MRRVGRHLALLSPALLLASCVSGPQGAPAEAFYALGHVDRPAAQQGATASETPEGELPQRDIAADLEAWRKKFRENARQLRALSWNCRVRYRMPGSFTIHLLYRAAADANGDVQVTEVTRRLEPAQGLTRAENAIEATDADFAMAGTLGALTRAYTFPPPGTLDRLLQTENLGEIPPGGGLILRQAQYVMPDDNVELALSPSLIEPQTLTFHAAPDGNAVDGKVKYRKLPDGTFFPATMDLTVSATGATAFVENFGFRTQPRQEAATPQP